MWNCSRNFFQLSSKLLGRMRGPGQIFLVNLQPMEFMVTSVFDFSLLLMVIICRLVSCSAWMQSHVSSLEANSRRLTMISYSHTI